MQVSRIDLNLLVVLETIHSEGSITKAAERLHLTRSAVSHALSRLRDMLEDPLFERQGSEMVPTPLARRLIDPLRDSLTQIGVLLNEVQTFDPAVAQRRYLIGLRDFLDHASINYGPANQWLRELVLRSFQNWSVTSPFNVATWRE